jgi:plastocyanin
MVGMRPKKNKIQIVIASIAMLLCSAVAAAAGDLVGRVTILGKSDHQPLKSSANALVYLDGPVEPAQGMVTMDQRNKEFIPRLLPVIIGQKVLFKNSDVFQHNVFSPHAQEPFDLGRYRPGETRMITLKVIGPHSVYCDIHQNMIADIFVVPNRYFGLTDEQGRFRIKNVPPGTYRLNAWHILGGETTQTVQVAQTDVSIKLSLQSTKLLKEMSRHKNKEGRAYRPEFEYGDY